MLFENCNTATLQQREQTDRKKMGKSLTLFENRNPTAVSLQRQNEVGNLLPHEAVKFPRALRKFFTRERKILIEN